MIGREITQTYPPKPPPVAPTPTSALDVRDLTWGNRLRGISLRVRRGEILGLGGLDGQGQRELLLALFGVLKDVRGSVTVNGAAVAFAGPKAAMTAAIPIALVPEDRKTEGLLLRLPLRDNLSLASLDRLRRGLFLDRRAEQLLVTNATERLRIAAASPSVAVGTLSGGNQQKVVVGKWLATDPGILLLMDPTRGIDVGTKQEMYQLLRRLADSGAAIVFYSTDYDELIGCCDRVLILYGGRVIRTLEGDAITETNIVASALNLETNGQAAEAVPA